MFDDEVEAYDDWRKRLVICSAAFLIIASYKKIDDARKRKRKIWTHSYLLRRAQRGMHRNMFLELAIKDPDRFRSCLRMDASTFEYLLDKVTPLIKKEDTNMRQRISPEQRLSLTLRHLATGDCQESLRLSFRMGQSTISGIIRDVTKALCDVLLQEFIPFPSAEDEWLLVADDFERKWNFSNCIGAVDGKHCQIDVPISSGSDFYNYKGFSSVIPFALADAHLRFIYVDTGKNGRMSDTAIWNRCSVKEHLDANTMHIPAPRPLPNSDDRFRFVILGDSIFPLGMNLLTPYPKEQLLHCNETKIFNYRLSRPRRCVENAFGVLSARFQILRSTIRYDPDVAAVIITACCCLYDMLRSQAIGRAMYTPHHFIDTEDLIAGRVDFGEWRNEPAVGMQYLRRQGGNRHRRDAIDLRNDWCNYFNTVGAVPWQARMACVE